MALFLELVPVVEYSYGFLCYFYCVFYEFARGAVYDYCIYSAPLGAVNACIVSMADASISKLGTPSALRSSIRLFIQLCL